MVEQVRRCSVTDTILKSVIRSYREYVRICDFTMGVYETPEYWYTCLLYTSPSPRDGLLSRMPSSA